MNRKGILGMAAAAAVLATAGGAVVFAQGHPDKYTLKTASGIAFSDFKGYEDWAVVSSTHTPNGRLKVIVGNPVMVEAYRSGIPGNGRPFPEGSKIAKLQWKFKKSTEATFDADVPDTFAEAFLMEKDSKRFPDSGGWGYAVFNYDPATDRYTPTADPANCGQVCHVTVKAKDYVFHPYQRR
jgi:hypothetical protein